MKLLGDELLENLPRKRLLYLAHEAAAKGKRKYRGVPLWSFIGEITSHGSGYSAAIAQACGWNPSQSASEPLSYDWKAEVKGGKSG